MATAPTTAPTWDPAELPPLPVLRFTVAEYQALVRSGGFPEEPRHELLEGWITPKMTKNPPHENTIDKIQEVLRAMLPPGWRLRTQSAITTGDSEPEPDLALARGSLQEFQRRHPGPADLALVVEVAESSLAVDRGLKARIYARAGIPAYWIVNLVDHRIEVHSQPSGPADAPAYARVEAVGPEGSLPLVLDGVEIGPVAARDLLP